MPAECSQPHNLSRPVGAEVILRFSILAANFVILFSSMTIDDVRALATKVREKTATPEEETAFYKALDVFMQKTEILLSLHQSAS